MVKLNYAVLEFDHIVEFVKDSTVFAAARENGNGHIRLFLIFESGNGRVYTRNGRIDSWEQMFDSDAENIRNRVSAAKNNHIPVYKIKGANGSL